MLSRRKAQGQGQMGLAHTWWTKEYHILPILQEAHGGQLVDLALVDGGLEGEIKVVQGLFDGEAGHLPFSHLWPQMLSLQQCIYTKNLMADLTVSGLLCRIV